MTAAETLRTAAKAMRHDADAMFAADATVFGAIADWIDWMANRADSSNGTPAMRGLGLEQALAVAHAYLNTQDTP